MNTPLEPFAVRAERVLSVTFRGIHNCDKIIKADPPYEMWEVNTIQNLSTFDFDRLTRLVIAAHDNCVRVDVGSSGPRMVKIRLWPREREGDSTQRHPTIEQAIERIRGTQ